jgi:integrase
VEADRRQPGQARSAEPGPALPGAAAIRFLGADPLARRAARAELRANCRVRRRDRARPSELFALEQGDVDRAAGVVQVRRAYANGRVKQTKTRLSRRVVPLQAIALEALDELPQRNDTSLLFPNSRGGHLDFRNFNPPTLEARPEKSRNRAATRPLRPAPHLCHLRAPRGRPGVRPLAVHGHEHRDDRSPLRPPRGRQLPARRVASRRARARTGRGRWVDVGTKAGNAAPRHGFSGSREAFPAGGGRSVDVDAPTTRCQT